MNLVDSSGWLEYFTDGPNAGFFAPAIEDAAAQGRIVRVDDAIALSAAGLSVRHRLPMADSLTLATARAHDAILWTQDADFVGLPAVRLPPGRA